MRDVSVRAIVVRYPFSRIHTLEDVELVFRPLGLARY